MSEDSKIVALVKPLLIARPPLEQADMLAELIASWICSYKSTDPHAERMSRHDKFRFFCAEVWKRVE